MPDGRGLEGAWDLRGHEVPYFGGVELPAKRVLELGPGEHTQKHRLGHVATAE
ncbi:MAG: hypothetical protein WBG41_10930 [Acidimicrobiales bacterium]